MFKNMKQVERYFENRAHYGIKPGLFRMYYLLDYVNNPQKKFKAVHITGTNGKGSILSYMKQALIANNYKVGSFISPSFEGFLGHICINNDTITQNEWINRLNLLYPAITELDAKNNHPTEFEIITVLAFDFFANQVDVALIETGMGGREDTTNCVHPILSIITNVDKDHVHFLGPTIQDIAYHKAGIIKQTVPAIIGSAEQEALDVIKQEIDLQETEGYFLGSDFFYHDMTSSNKYEQFMWSYKEQSRKARIKMVGEHQVINCAIAIMALTVIGKTYFKINWKKTLQAIEQTTMPGRFEPIKQNPPIILDGAHNVSGIKAFIKTVCTRYPEKQKHLIFAAFKDKDITSLLLELEDIFTSITMTTFNHKRAANKEDFIKSSNQHHHFIEDWQEALREIKVNETYYFITGSLHFISVVRQYLNETTSFDK